MIFKFVFNISIDDAPAAATAAVVAPAAVFIVVSIRNWRPAAKVSRRDRTQILPKENSLKRAVK